MAGDEAVASEPDYSLALRALNGYITSFKNEMKSCIADYVRLKDSGQINIQNVAKHVQGELDNLLEKRQTVVETVPETEIKAKLGRNYYFHTKINSLSSSVVDYFEINYTLRTD